MRHRRACLESDEKTDGARKQDVVGDKVTMIIWGQIMGED